MPHSIFYIIKPFNKDIPAIIRPFKFSIGSYNMPQNAILTEFS